MSNETITTVVTPAGSYDLTDLTTVKDELSIKSTDTSNDSFLGRGITQVSKAIANYCNRVFPVETVKDVIYLDRNLLLRVNVASVTLQLSRWPVTAITSVVEDAGLDSELTLVQNTDYLPDSLTGQLIRIDSTTGLRRRWASRTVTVQYSAGYSIIPEDVVDACLRMMTQRFKQKSRDPMLMSQNTPSVGEQRWWVGTAPGQNGAFPPEISGLLDSYRMPPISQI